MSVVNPVIGNLMSLFLSCLSGILLAVAFPPYDYGWVAFTGFIPLLFAITDRRPIAACGLSYLSGLVFFSGVFAWILSVPGYDLRHQVIIIPYLALYFGSFGWIYAFVSQRMGMYTALCTVPFAWVCLEFVRSNAFFLSLPWALLSHSQYMRHNLIQVAAVTGAFGVSFIVISVNVVLFLIILKITPLKRKFWNVNGHPFPRNKQIFSLCFITMLLVAGSWLYGDRLMKRYTISDTVRASVLQGNIGHEMKTDPKKHDKFIMGTYENLTRQAYKENPDLIVWPEASTPGFVLKNLSLYQRMSTLIQEGTAHFLVGSAEYAKFVTPEEAEKREVGNTAIFFSPSAKILGQYLKINLVPFGEYVPLKDIVPWPDALVPPSKKKVREIPGSEFTLFSLEANKFGVLICWEVVFPDLFRQFVKSGANFMINISNEGWFGDTAAPHQMAAINVFRAVENRIAVTRSTNTGISCFIDPLGRINGRVRDDKGKDTFISGYLTQDIPLMRERTFYTRHGDLFTYACIAISLVMVLIAIFRRASR